MALKARKAKIGICSSCAERVEVDAPRWFLAGLFAKQELIYEKRQKQEMQENVHRYLKAIADCIDK